MTTSATPEPAPHRGPGRPFLPGQSGNPSGRPKGSRNKHTLAAEALLAGKLERAGQVVDTGLSENKLQAAGLVFRSLIARPRAEGPTFDMPPIDTPDDVAPASAAILAAASAGLLTPTEAFAMHKVVEARAILIGWAPPERAAPDNSPVVFIRHSVEHTPDGMTEPLSLFIPGEAIHYDANGVRTRYRRIDPPTQEEIAEALAARRAEARRREAPASPLPALSSPEPPEPPQAEAPNSDPCIFSQDTASPPPAPAASPAPTLPKHPDLIDAERSLAKWQGIAADTSLAEHKREAAKLEILRYSSQVERLQAPGGGPPIRIIVTEPGQEPPAEPEPDWPPPPRTITIDVPLLWTPAAHRKWLADEGLPVHPTDEILCRRPTREPEIVSVLPKDSGAPPTLVNPGQEFHGEAARTKTGGSS